MHFIHVLHLYIKLIMLITYCKIYLHATIHKFQEWWSLEYLKWDGLYSHPKLKETGNEYIQWIQEYELKYKFHLNLSAKLPVTQWHLIICFHDYNLLPKMYLKLKKSSIPRVILLDKIDQNQSLTQWLWYITEYTFIKVVTPV